MPFAFSTLGCPHATPAEVIDLAHSSGARGVELRAGDDQIVRTTMTGRERAEVRKQFSAAALTVLAVASYVRICSSESDVRIGDDLSEYLQLAHDVGAQGVRVFPGAQVPDPLADQTAGRRLAEVAPLAAELNVLIYLETHDSHPRGVDVARILTELDRQAPGHPVRIIWDALHPWNAGESPRATYAALGSWLAYVQIKDARADPPGSLTLVGEGDLPLDDIADLLQDRPELWWSLEWEKPWHPELPELRVALDSASTWFGSHVVRPAHGSLGR